MSSIVQLGSGIFQFPSPSSTQKVTARSTRTSFDAVGELGIKGGAPNGPTAALFVAAARSGTGLGEKFNVFEIAAFVRWEGNVGSCVGAPAGTTGFVTVCDDCGATEVGGVFPDTGSFGLTVVLFDFSVVPSSLEGVA